MKIAFPKNFRLLKYMNASHTFIERAGFASIGWIGTLVATGSTVLAKETAGRFYREDNFKLGLRRCAWYSRRSWINLHVSKDNMFDFTEGLSSCHLRAVDRFIDRRANKTPLLLHRGDKCYVTARLLSLSENLEDQTALAGLFRERTNEFLQDAAQKIEERLEPHPPAFPKPRPSFPVEDARLALRDFAELFPMASYPWFLVSGTFLGLVREGDFLAHDYDIDLGIFGNAVDFDAVGDMLDDNPNFTLRRFDVHHFLTKQGKRLPVLLKVTHRLGVHIDLFVHYREGDTVWHGSSLHRWDNSAFDLVPYDFKGLEVLGPKDADRYLRENYGEWRVPVTDFNCTTDTPNMAIVQHLVSFAVFLRKMLIDNRLDTDKSIQLCRMLENEGHIVPSTTHPSVYTMGSDIGLMHDAEASRSSP